MPLHCHTFTHSHTHSHTHTHTLTWRRCSCGWPESSFCLQPVPFHTHRNLSRGAILLLLASTLIQYTRLPHLISIEANLHFNTHAVRCTPPASTEDGIHFYDLSVLLLRRCFMRGFCARERKRTSERPPWSNPACVCVCVCVCVCMCRDGCHLILREYPFSALWGASNTSQSINKSIIHVIRINAVPLRSFYGLFK